MKKRKMAGPAVALLLSALMLLSAACGAADPAGSAGSGSSSTNQGASAPGVAATGDYGTAMTADRAGESENAAQSSLPPGGSAEPGASGATAPSGTAVPSGAMDRKLIYNASVTMEVADYGAAQTELFNLVTLSGGYLLNFSDTQSRYELGGTFVIKVPSRGFQSFLSNLEQLALKPEEVQRSVWGQDVTEEYVDLSSRLKAKQVVEERLLSFMEKATDTENLLQFSNELARVQEEIETIKGRMRYLDQNVAFSTVELRMYKRLGEKEAEKQNVVHRAGKAMKDSGLAILALFEGLLVVLAGALPILLILLLLLVPLRMLYRRLRKNRPQLWTARGGGSGSYVTKIDTAGHGAGGAGASSAESRDDADPAADGEERSGRDGESRQESGGPREGDDGGGKTP